MPEILTPDEEFQKRLREQNDPAFQAAEAERALKAGAPTPVPEDANPDDLVQSLQPTDLDKSSSVTVDGISFDVGLPGSAPPSSPFDYEEQKAQEADERNLRSMRRIDSGVSRLRSLLDMEPGKYTGSQAEDALLYSLVDPQGRSPEVLLPVIDKIRASDDWINADWAKAGRDNPAAIGMILSGPIAAQKLAIEAKPLTIWEDWVTGRWSTDKSIRLTKPWLERTGEGLGLTAATALHWFGGEEGDKWLEGIQDRIQPDLNDPTGLQQFLTNSVSAAGFIGINLAGAGIGRAIGGGIAAFAGPEAIPAGMWIGGVIGDVVTNILVGTDDMERQLKQIEGMDDDMARTLAVFASGIQGVVANAGTAGFAKAAGLRGPIAEKFGIQVAEKTFKKLTEPGFVGSFAKGYGKAEVHAAATLAGMAAINSLTYELGEVYGSGNIDDLDLDKVASQTIDGVFAGLKDFALLSLVPGWSRHISDQKLYRDTLADITAMEGVVAGVEKSSLKGKPGLLAAVFDALGEKAGGGRRLWTWVTKDAIDRHAAKEGLDAAGIARELGVSDEDWQAAQTTGSVKVKTSVFLDKIIATGKLPDFAQDLKWNESGRTVRELNNEVSLLMFQADKQFKEKRKIEVKGEEIPPALAVQEDIEWALLKQGARASVAKGVAEAFAHYFAMLSVKTGRYGDVDWDAYSLWARNPLWFRLSGASDEGGVFVNPYTRTAHFFTNRPSEGAPFATKMKIVPDIAAIAAGNVTWDFGRYGSENGGREFHLIRENETGPYDQSQPYLGLAGNANGILYVVKDTLAQGMPWNTGVTDKAAQGMRGAKIISREQLQNLIEKGGKGKVYVVDPETLAEARHVDPTDPEGGLMPATLNSISNGRWLTLDEFADEYRVSLARAGRPDLGDAAGVLGSSRGRKERGGLDPDGTAYITDFHLGVGRETSRAAERLTEPHEMTHYADAVFVNVVSDLKDSAPRRLQEDFREIQSWVGIPSLDANGKPLSAYHMAQLKVAASWLSNNKTRGVVDRKTIETAKQKFPRAPLEGLDEAGATRLAENEKAGAERLAYAFQAFIANGVSPVPRLESAFTQMAQYARMFQLEVWGKRGSRTLRGARGLTAFGGMVLADSGAYKMEGFAERSQPYGVEGEVPTAFARFFAADDALIGVGADRRLSPEIAVTAGPIPEYDGFPTAHGGTGEAGKRTLKPLKKAELAAYYGFDQNEAGSLDEGVQREEGSTPDKKFTPEERERIRKLRDLGQMFRTPEEKAAARVKLMDWLKDSESAVQTPGGANLKGKRKINWEVNQEREKLKEQVENDVRNDPVARAMVAVGGRLDHLPPEQKAAIEGFTKAGVQFRLDYETTKAKYGKEVADSLPDYMYARGRKANRTSVDLETMAGVFGLEPQSFLERAGELRSFRDYVDRSVQGRLMLRFGEILTDPAALFDAALEASFNNDRSVEKAIEQWRALAAAIGDEHFIARADHATLETFRKTAAKWVSGDRQLWRLQPEQIAKAQQKQWQKAFEAAVNNDWKAAFEAKEKQLWLHTLYLAAEERRSQMDALRADLEGRMSREAYRSKIGKAAPALREVHDGLLELVGLREPKPGEDSYVPVLLSRVKDVVDYAKQKAQVLMFDPQEIEDLVRDVAGRIASQKSGGPTIQARRNAWSNWSYLTVDEALMVERVVKQIARWAKEEKEYQKAGEAMEIADMTQMVQNDAVRKHLPELETGHYVLTRSATTKWTETARNLQAWDGNLTETETMLGMISEGLRDSIMSEFRAARGRRDTLAAMINGWWDENWIKSMNRREVRQRMLEKVDLKKYNLDIKFDPKRVEDPIVQDANRSTVMMMALHMGNPENEWRLLQGYGWAKDDVLKMIGDVLSDEELQFVQKTWDFFNQNLWPFVKDKTERQTGLPLRAVKAAALDVPRPDGSYVYLKGGYFPARYDRNLATREQTLHATETDLGYYYKGDYSRQVPYTYKGHTKARTPGYYDRLSLDFGILSGHLVQVIHDIAFDDFVKNTGKLFQDHDFNATMVRYLGTERVLQLQDWLWGVANGYVENVAQSQRRIVNQFQGLRDKTVLGILGHSLGVAAGDLTNVPVAIAAGRVSLTNALAVTRDLGGHMFSRDIDAWYEELRGKSTVVNTRSQHWVLELRKRMQDPLRGETWAEAATKKLAGEKAAEKVGDTYAYNIERVRETAFFLQQAIDKYSSIVIWEGAYRDAEGMPEQERIKHADTMLENTLPGLEKMNQAGLLRSRNVVGSLLLFHGYFNKLFNILRQDYHSKVYEPYLAAKAGDISKTAAGLSATKYAGEMLAIFFITNVVAEWASGRGKDKRETVEQYLTRKMLAAPLTMVPFGAPVGEVIGNYVSGSPVGKGVRNQNFSMRQSPQMALIEQLGRLGSEIVDTAEGKRPMDKGAFSLLEAYLYANGLPARQWRRSAQYIYDASSGRYPPRSVGDALSGVAYGQRKNQPGNPLKLVGEIETGELWR